jgi:hypothetical protein
VTSCTVVMGPSSGTLIFRLRMRLWCSLIRILSPVTAVILSVLSPFWPIAKAYACPGSSALAGAAAGCLSLGKSWYFRSGCCILQAKGFSPEGDALPNCGERAGELWPTARDGTLAGERLKWLHTDSLECCGETAFAI